MSGNTFNADEAMTGFKGTALSGTCPEPPLRRPERSERGFRSRRNADGDLTGDGTNSYYWDARNELRTISVNGTVTARFVGAYPESL